MPRGSTYCRCPIWCNRRMTFVASVTGSLRACTTWPNYCAANTYCDPVGGSELRRRAMISWINFIPGGNSAAENFPMVDRSESHLIAREQRNRRGDDGAN